MRVRFPRDTKMTDPPHGLTDRLILAGTVLEVKDEAGAWLLERKVAEAVGPPAPSVPREPAAPPRRRRRRDTGDD